jgi:hypothetical protein
VSADAAPPKSSNSARVMTLEDHIGHHSADGQTDKSYLMTQPSLDRASKTNAPQAPPTGLGSGAYKHNVYYSVFSGDWCIGRIYERHGFPDAVRFFWSLHGVVLTRPPSVHTDGHAPTLEEAKEQFQKSWDA